MEDFITVFTPTYNREKTLKRLYISLNNQTRTNFEWIIVDDGSTDKTEEIVRSFIQDSNHYKITYVKQENGGKHRAINRGLDLAKGNMFFIVDSDDYLTEDAIEKIIELKKTIKLSNGKFAGIAFSKGYSKEKLVGTTFKGKYIDATSLERKKYNINGDKAEIFYTDILRKNKFPEIEGEKFITEALVWNRIAKQGYKLRWVQDIIYICEYRDDGLSAKGKSVFNNSPKGLKLYIEETIENYNLKYLRKLLKYEYYSSAVYQNKEISKAAADLNISRWSLKLGVYIRKIINILKNKEDKEV